VSHPRHGLDDLLQHPVRLAVVATLAVTEQAEFGLVRDVVEVSDSMLSRQVSTLERAGIVRVHKGYVGRRPRTWLSLTARGRGSFATHVAALRAIVSPEGAGPTAPGGPAPAARPPG
jgi:DNA-binding HxlR family transcriptional regulator